MSDAFKTTLRATFILIVAVAILPVRASADEEKDADFPDLVGPDETGEIMDEFALLEMEAVIETTVLHAQPISHSPSAVTLLTREYIEASGARTLPEALRVVPNLDVRLVNPFWSEINIRGSQTSQDINSVLLLVDGRDLTLEFFGWPMWTSPHFSMDEVERIEVIRGPGSSLYGANAFAGVVNVKTYEPGEGPAASVSLRGGEHGGFEAACRASHRLGSLALAGSAGVRRQDFFTGRGTAGIELIHGRLGSRIDLGSGDSLLVEAGAYNSGGVARSTLGEIDLQSAFNLFGRARFSLDDLKIQAAYDYLDMSADVGMFMEFEGLLLARAPLVDGHLHKIDLSARHAVEGFHNRIAYGAEYVYNLYSFNILIPSDQDEHRAGFFVQDELDLGGLARELLDLDPEYLVLTAGMRVDYNTITRWELSPRAALVWAPSKRHSFRLGYGRAFLKPTFFEARMHVRLEDAQNLGFDELNVDSTGVQNETIDSLEAGYMGSFFDDVLQLSADLAYSWYWDGFEFHTREEDVVYRQIGPLLVPDISGPGRVLGNRYDFRGQTVEIQAVVKPAKGARLFCNAGYRQIFLVRMDDHPRNSYESSEPVWRLAGGGSLSSGGWSASVQAFYVSARIRNQRFGNLFGRIENVDIPAAWLVNARVAWTLAKNPVKLTAGLEGFNLLGNQVRESAGVSMPNRRDYGAERLDRRLVLFLHGQF